MISEFAKELLIPDFPELYLHLCKVFKLKGFPDRVIEIFQDQNTEVERISKFSGKFTNIVENREVQKLMKAQFVKKIVKKGIIKTFLLEEYHDKSRLDTFSQLLWNICYYCKNEHYVKKDIWSGH